MLRVDEPQRAYHLEVRVDAWMTPYFREVGELLARGPTGAGLLIERQTRDRPVLLVASSPWVDSVLHSAAARVPVRLVRRDPPPPAEPPDGVVVALGFLHPAPSTLTERPEPGVARGPLARDPLTFLGETEMRGLPFLPAENRSTPEAPDRVWAGVQTHWFAEGDGRLRVRCRFLVGAASGRAEVLAWQMGATLSRSVPGDRGVPPQVFVRRPTRRDLKEWSSGGLRRVKLGTSFVLPPSFAAELASVPLTDDAIDAGVTDLHAVVLGASGSGKSTFLVDLTRRHILAGDPAAVFDLHGDLSPAIVGRLPPEQAGRVVAVDATAPLDRIPGFAILGAAPPARRDREVAHVVAALRRVSSEGGETFWGPRLERIFDTLVRAAQDEGGGLLDVHALLTDARRREASRFTTRSPEVARFLDELPALLKRNPEFLWPAAARTSKLALDPRISRLLVPAETGLPIDDLFAAGRSVVWRLPIGDLGPEGATFVANLLLSRVYLGRTSLPGSAASDHPLLLVLDEAHAFSSSLLTEILSEGRKFGVRAVLATQYPDRLPPSLRAAAAGAVGTHVLFRIPRAAAAAAGSWAGVSPSEAQRILPALPPGVALVAPHGASSSRRLLHLPFPPAGDDAPWRARVEATATEHPSDGDGWTINIEPMEEAILLALLAGEGTGRGLRAEEVVRFALGLPSVEVEPTELLARLPGLLRRGWVQERGDTLHLTPAGARGLGCTPVTGATNESSEHRALLLSAFRVFARQGVRLEIVRQGRFDTRLPDARVTLLPVGPLLPRDLASRLDRLRSTWVWRAFGGRDVHVEAEVSGAERPERIRRGIAKAAARGAFVLFLVGNAAKSRRVGGVLRGAGLLPREAQVWTLRSVVHSGEPHGGGAEGDPHSGR